MSDISILDGVSTEETEAVRWVKSIADPANGIALATEYNAGTSVALECLMTERINPDGSVEMASLRRACSSKVRQRAGAQTRTIARMTAVYDPQNLAGALSKGYVAMPAREEGFLVVRRGIHLSTPAAGGQLTTIYKVQVTQRLELQAADNDEYQYAVDVAVQDWWENVPITPPPNWAATTAYTLGQYVTIVGPATGIVEATVAGTSSSSEPTLPGSVGGTVSDGTVTWTRRY